MKPFFICSLLAASTCLTTALAGPGSADHQAPVGAVYTMDNASLGNNLWVFSRGPGGELSPNAPVPTGGQGTGSGLGSQGALILSDDRHWVLVCNAGSDEISVFSVSDQGVQWASKTDSQGQNPISVTQHGNLVYVLNAGGAIGGMDNITGFTFADGQLTPLPNSSRGLSASSTGAVQISFTSDGATLVVTEKNTSLIDTFLLGDDGLVQDQNTFASPAAAPFGFAVGRHDRLFVSNAAGSPLSSYAVTADGGLETISDAVLNHQAAACWAALTGDERFVYTANAASGSISGYQVLPDGSVQLLNADGITGLTGPGSHPIDMAFSQNSRFLYNLASGNGTINVFRVGPNGALEGVAGVSGIPLSASGLAAR